MEEQGRAIRVSCQRLCFSPPVFPLRQMWCCCASSLTLVNSRRNQLSSLDPPRESDSPQPLSPCLSSGSPVSLSVPPPFSGLGGRIGDWWLSADRGCFRPNLAATVRAAPPLHAVRSAQASVRLSIGASISVIHTHMHTHTQLPSAHSLRYYNTPSHPVYAQTSQSFTRASTRIARARSRAMESSPLRVIDTVHFL